MRCQSRYQRCEDGSASCSSVIAEGLCMLQARIAVAIQGEIQSCSQLRSMPMGHAYPHERVGVILVQESKVA